MKIDEEIRFMEEKSKNIVRLLQQEKILSLFFLLCVFAFSFLVYGYWKQKKHVEICHCNELLTASNAKSMLHFNEVLTMSAKMYAATGDISYKNRYKDVEPELDKMIKEILNLNPKENVAALVRKTNEANAELVKMEYQSFDLVERGEKSEALQLLSSNDYVEQKIIYSNGIQNALESVRQFQNKESLEEKHAFLILIIVCLIGISAMFIAWLLFVRLTKQWMNERKQKEFALEKVMQKTKNILESAGEGIIGLDLDGKHIFVNPSACKMLGYQEGELIGKGSHEIWHHSKEDGAFYSYTECPIYMAYKNGKTHRSDQEFFWRKDGSSFPVEYSSRPVYEMNQLVGAVLTFSDITERKTAEKIIENSAKEWEMTFNSMTDGISIHDMDHNIINVNESVCKIFGKKKDEVVGQKCYWIFHCMDHPHEECPVSLSMRTGNKEQCEMFEPSLKRWISVSASPVKDEKGQLIYMIHSIRDITERKTAEQIIKRNFDNQIVINHLLNTQLMDLSLEDILKKALDELLAVPWLSLEQRGAIFIAEDNPNAMVMKIQRNLSDPVRKFCSSVQFGKCLCGRAALSKQVVFENDLNEKHEVRYEGMGNHGHYCVPIVHGNRTLGVICVFVEKGTQYNQENVDFLRSMADILAGIIQRKEIESEKEEIRKLLYQSQKMEAVGQLAAGVAHEVNNPLAVIMGFAQSIISKMQEDHPFLKSLKSIERESKRCKNLIHNLLAFSRMEGAEKEKNDINEIVDNALSLVTAQAKFDSVEVIKEYEKELPKIWANNNQIQQVIINICNNAIDAMPDGGTLTISTRFHREAPMYAKNSLTANGLYDTDTVEVAISDTGTGISKEDQSKIFNPFYTTKEVGKGTGLGLSLVHEIMKKHNGTIGIVSEVGKGTTFYLVFSTHSKTVAENDGKKRILIGDDEPEILQMIGRGLSGLGFDVVFAEDGFQMGKLLNEYIPDLIILDIFLPGIDGLRICEMIRADIKMRDIKILAISGKKVSKEQLIQAGVNDLLVKPFDMDELKNKIAELLLGAGVK